jgi:hypothetical protein
MKYRTSFKKDRSLCSLLKVGFWCSIFVASLLIFQGSAYSAQITLAWDSSDGAAGYKIYYGTTSHTYTSFVDVGNNLTYTFPEFPDWNTYYFAATAYDDSNLESDYSDEISSGATLDTLLYTSFTEYGLYIYDGTIGARLDALAPTSMAASGTTLYAGYTGHGLYKYNGTTWTRLDALAPTSMAASGTTLYASYTGHGLYKYDGATWTRLDTLVPISMAVSGTTLYASYTGHGLYKYNGATWTLIDSLAPTSMAVSGTTLYASYTGHGLYKYNGTTWTRLDTRVPVSVAVGK